MTSLNKNEARIWSGIFTLVLILAVVHITRAVSADRTEAPSFRSYVFEPVYQMEEFETVEPATMDFVKVSDLLVEAVIQVESAGNPHCVGRAGERGLMQIKEATWADTTLKLFGRKVSFDRAFEPRLNVEVGRAYLSGLQEYLAPHRDQWKADERSILLAAYNAGPNALIRSGFDPSRLSAVTVDYVKRCSALHDHLLADDAGELRKLLLAYLEPGPSS